jgi:4-amino-4-deoxy-L-arabinose transferase-like glycosyltransferase
VLLFTALGRADLFNPDEPREAEMAREMAVAGDLLVPRLNDQPFLEKPPLFYWLVISAYRAAGGPGEAAARFVPALAGLLTVLLTFFMGRDLVGERGATLGALVLLTAFEFWWLARRCMIDMPLTLAVVFACLALHRGMVRGGPRRRAWLAAGYLATGAAVLFKGIVGAGIPALAVCGYLAARRDGRGIVRHHLVPGALLALLPAAAWTVLLHRRLGAEATREFVLVNNLLRFTGGAGKGHDNPFYYYLPTLLVEFLPWSLVLPFALLAAWRAWRRTPVGGRAAGGGGPAPAGAPAGGGLEEAGAASGGATQASILFALSWFVLPLAVLSIASTKRGIYLVPIYPAAALLVGWWMARPGPPERERPGPDDAAFRGGSRAAFHLLLGALIVIAGTSLAVLRLARPADWLAPAALLALLLPPGILAYRAARAGRGGSLVVSGAALTGVVHLALAVLVVPAVVERAASARPAAALLRRLVQAGDRVALYDFKEGMLGGYLFYSGMTYPNLERVEDLRAHLLAAPGGGRGPCSLALVREDVYRALEPRLGVPTSVAARFGDGSTLAAMARRRPVLLVVAEAGARPETRAP